MECHYCGDSGLARDFDFGGAFSFSAHIVVVQLYIQKQRPTVFVHALLLRKLQF